MEKHNVKEQKMAEFSYRGSVVRTSPSVGMENVLLEMHKIL